MIELIRCENKEQWDDYILEHNGHPLQLWSWGQVKATNGWSATRLFAYEGDALIGAVQVLIRPLPFPFKAFAYVPRGPLFDEQYRDEALKALEQRVKHEYGALALSIEPDVTEFELSAGWRQAKNTILSPETILLDIGKSESDLMAAMAKKTRQYIRKSASDVRIEKARSLDDVEVCLDIYRQTAARAGFNLHDEQYYRDVFIQMRDHSPIFIAYENDTPVSFLWLAISETTAYELYGGMTDRGQELRANYALKWHAIRKVKEWGLKRYDFGGLVAGGVSTFKQGWSSEVTTFAGTLDRPLSPLYGLWTTGLPYVKKTLQRLRKRNS